jgi:DNA-binding YbaB/EbfC family protein
MFKEIGQLANLMRQLPKIKEEAEQFQAKLNQIQVEGSAGGDMVTVRVNGRMEIIGVKITEAAWAMQDREMIEDLFASAANQALGKAREIVNGEMQSMAQNLGLPPGAGLPGLS